jgi:hypothetical protein
MQFLWFLAHDDGSVTMKYRGEPDDWDEAVKSNLLMAVKDLLVGLSEDDAEELQPVEELPLSVGNIIPYRPRTVKGH